MLLRTDWMKQMTEYPYNPFVGDTILPSMNTSLSYHKKRTAEEIFKSRDRELEFLKHRDREGIYTERIKQRIDPEMLAEQLGKLVEEGDLTAIKIVLDRLEPTTQKVEVNNVSNPIVEGLKNLLEKDEIRVVKDMTGEEND